MAIAGDCERTFVYRDDRLSVADAAERFSSLFDGTEVLLLVAR